MNIIEDENVDANNTTVERERVAGDKNPTYNKVQNVIAVDGKCAPLFMSISLPPDAKVVIKLPVNGSKVAIITSRMGSIDDNTSGGCYGYRISKAAVNMAGMNLHRDLSPSGISVGLFHPGFVATDMTAGFQSSDKISPEKSANGLLKLITALTPATSGRFVSYTGDVIAW